MGSLEATKHEVFPTIGGSRCWLNVQPLREVDASLRRRVDRDRSGITGARSIE